MNLTMLQTAVHARLVFPDLEDEKAVLDLLRPFPAAGPAAPIPGGPFFSPSARRLAPRAQRPWGRRASLVGGLCAEMCAAGAPGPGAALLSPLKERKK